MATILRSCCHFHETILLSSKHNIITFCFPRPRGNIANHFSPSLGWPRPSIMIWSSNHTEVWLQSKMTNANQRKIWFLRRFDCWGNGALPPVERKQLEGPSIVLKEKTKHYLVWGPRMNHDEFVKQLQLWSNYSEEGTNVLICKSVKTIKICQWHYANDRAKGRWAKSNIVQSSCKVVSIRSQICPSFVPKLCKICSTVVPKLSQSCPKVAPKLSQLQCRFKVVSLSS